MSVVGRDAQRTEEALRAADIGVWDWDVVTGRLFWDATIARLHGVDPENFEGTIETFFARVHPDDRPRVQTAIDAALRRGGSFLTEYRVVHPSGETRWIQGRGTAVLAADGTPLRMIGLGMETTELRNARERAGRSMDFASDGLALIDPDWRVAYLNPAASRILGYDLRDIVGRNLWKLLPDAVDTWFSERLYKAASTLEATRFRVNYGPLGGWFELSVFPAPDGLTVFFRNIEDELAAEVERERLVESLELALERSHHLQTITERLADTITVREVAQTVLKYTRAALGTLYAGLALVDERREFLEFEEQHALPRAIHENWGRVPLSTDAPVTAAVVERRSTFYETSDELLAHYPNLEGAVALVGQGAFATLPLLSSGRAIGVLSVSWADPREIPGPMREFLATVAAQCSQAIERARLFERERATAQRLQAAILPEVLPAVGELRCAGRYLPAEWGIDVGGDWYDAFLLADGRVALVVGDVAGHGLPAASTMTQLRNMLRAYAFDTPSPADVLSRLDHVLVETGSEEYATCFYATLDVEGRTLLFANAGHPAPVVIPPGQPPRLLPMATAPLLGSGTTPAEESVVLEPGTTVLLFTDGLIERRARTMAEGLDAVLACAAEVPAEDLDALCDAVLERAAAGMPREDDLCVLAVRLLGPGETAPTPVPPRRFGRARRGPRRRGSIR